MTDGSYLPVFSLELELNTLSNLLKGVYEIRSIPENKERSV